VTAIGLLTGIFLLLAPLVVGNAQENCADCRGLGVEAVYIGEQWRNSSGGLRTGTTYLDNLELILYADAGSLGIPGLGGRVNVLRNNANEFSSEFVGDLQIVSNIEAPEAWRVYEAWLEFSPRAGSAFNIRAGIYAADQEFDVAPTGALFLHSAGGTGSDYALAGVDGPPIFPLSGFGIRFGGTWGRSGYWRAAVMDGIPGNPDDFQDFYYRWNDDDGALLQGEFGVQNASWNKLALGLWTYSTEQELLSTDTEGNPRKGKWDTGVYAILDRLLASGTRGDINGYLRLGATSDGFADRGRFNTITGFVGAGVTWDGFLSGREYDQFGFLVAAAFANEELRRARREEGLDTKRHETALELTYRLQLTDWLALQPDLQYVINPGLDPELDDALVVGIRFELVLGKQW